MLKKLNKYFQVANIATRCILMHKLRSALSLCGVMCGVMAVLTMVAIGEGAKEELISRIEQLGTKNIYIKASPLTKAREHDAIEKLSRGLTIYDRGRIKAGCVYVKDIVCVKDVKADIFGVSSDVSPRIMACTSEYAAVQGLQPVLGRFFKPSDVSAGEMVCVIGDSIADRIGADGNVGGHIQIGGHVFKVIGHLGRVEWNPDKNAVISVKNYNEMVFIPLGLDRLFINEASAGSISRLDTLTEMVVAVKDIKHVFDAGDIIKRVLEVTHNGVNDYQVVIPEELLMEARKTQKTFNMVLAAIGSISLLVGGIGIMNIMLATVSERTREIGIRRAVGATKNDIIIQFLAETILLTFSGGIIGVVFGVIVVFFISIFASWPIMITTWAILLPLILSVIIGIFFGLFPAVKASAMDPITALRYE